MKILERYSSPDDSCHQLAQELSKELVTTFSYILDPKDKEFCPEYLVATYLTPEWRFLIKSEQMPAIRKYLQGNLGFNLKLLFVDYVLTMINLGVVNCGADIAAAGNDSSLMFCLEGYEEFQEEFTSSLTSSSNGRGKFIVRKYPY